MVVTLDALHAQRETARLITADKDAHYLMFVKANQPGPAGPRSPAALAGTDAEFAGATWTEEGKGHGRREKRSIRTAPADGIDWPARRPGPAHPPRHRPHPRPLGGQGDRLRHHQPPRRPRRPPPPGHLRPPPLGNREQGALRPRRHVPGRRAEGPHREHAQPAYAALRNLVIGAFRKARLRQHRPRPPLLRPRRPAHPRPLRIRLNRGQEHQARDANTQEPCLRGDCVQAPRGPGCCRCLRGDTGRHGRRARPDTQGADHRRMRPPRQGRTGRRVRRPAARPSRRGGRRPRAHARRRARRVRAQRRRRRQGGRPAARLGAPRGLLHAWDDAATDAIIHATTDEAWRVREMAGKVIAGTASAPRSPRSPSFAPTRSRECERRLNARCYPHRRGRLTAATTQATTGGSPP